MSPAAWATPEGCRATRTWRTTRSSASSCTPSWPRRTSRRSCRRAGCPGCRRGRACSKPACIRTPSLSSPSGRDHAHQLLRDRVRPRGPAARAGDCAGSLASLERCRGCRFRMQHACATAPLPALLQVVNKERSDLEEAKAQLIVQACAGSGWACICREAMRHGRAGGTLPHSGSHARASPSVPFLTAAEQRVHPQAARAG